MYEEIEDRTYHLFIDVYLVYDRPWGQPLLLTTYKNYHNLISDTISIPKVCYAINSNKNLIIFY